MSEAGFTGFIGFSGLGSCLNWDFCDFCDSCDFDRDGGVVRSRIFRSERSRESEFPPTEPQIIPFLKVYIALTAPERTDSQSMLQGGTGSQSMLQGGNPN